jgi:hypothetical protein
MQQIILTNLCAEKDYLLLGTLISLSQGNFSQLIHYLICIYIRLWKQLPNCRKGYISDQPFFQSWVQKFLLTNLVMNVLSSSIGQQALSHIHYHLLVNSPAAYKLISSFFQASWNWVSWHCKTLLYLFVGICDITHSDNFVCTYAWYVTRMSYQLIDTFVWLGIWGIINDFWKKKLKLYTITSWSGSQASITNLLIGYLWSPQLIPKPNGGLTWFHQLWSMSYHGGSSVHNAQLRLV